MDKKYIAQLRSRRGTVGLCGVLVIAVAGTSAVAMLMQTKIVPIATIANSAPPKVKGVSTDKPPQSVKQNAPANTTGDISQPTATSTTVQTHITAPPSATTTTPPPSTATKPPAIPPAPTPTITGLYLDQPYFDDNKAPVVTFTVPVTASGSGNVIISWVQEETNATICSVTATFTSSGSKTVDCTVTLPSPPHGVWAHATDATGTIYAGYPTKVGIGGSSW